LPIHKSAKKRIRQDKVKNMRNKIIKKKVKTLSKKIINSEQSEQEEKKEILNKAYSAIDKAAKKNIFHKNKAARLKSKLARNKQTISSK